MRDLSGGNGDQQYTARGVPSDLFKAETTGTGDARSAPGQSSYSIYFDILSNIFAISQPLLRERFLNELPGSLVCILSERTDCGLEAELTRIVISASQGPLRSFVASARSQTCPLSKSITSTSFFSSYLRVEDTTLNQINAFEDMLVTALLNIPLNATNNFISSWNKLIDLTMPSIVSYVSGFMVTFLQTPMEFIKIALQLGIEIPALDQRVQCHQGDLKQLLMWGMMHNLSWSFGESLLDMLFAPELPLCGYPGAECELGPQQVSRSAPSDANASEPLLSCERTKLAPLNATLCAELPQTPPSTLSSLCRALSWLSPQQVRQVWRNSCHAVHTLLDPFLDEAACSQQPLSPEDASTTTTTLRRVARSNRSLKELLCVYENWTASGAVDPSVVSLCAENFQEEFVPRVCNNVQVFSVLLADATNTWLWRYCFNNSRDFMVSRHCAYDTWGPESVQPAMVTLCWTFEHDQFKALLCGFSLDFFNLIFSNPENTWLRPNCTQQPEEVDLVSLVAEACQYGQWDIEAQVTAEKLSVCFQNDELGFRLRVCGNATFLAELLKDAVYGWVRDFCDTAPSPMPPTDPQIDILQWCNYTQWDRIPIDPSVVGLCWQMDQLGFQKNVCCNLNLFEHLTLDPLNEWLTSVCVDVKERVDVVAQTCLYSDWKHAIIVDMTDLALCADQDPENFTRNVCTDQVVLQNLLANLDNTWLLQHCANHSAAVDPARHCQYASWTVVLPDPFFLAFCWDYDQVNFVASVCSNRPVLSLLSQESSSAWVGTLCATYANYTTTTTTTTTTATTTNFQEEFVPRVCNNVQVFSVLLADATNTWLWRYCFNNSRDFMVSRHCAYDTWGPESVQPAMVTLCWTFEHDQFKALLCGFSLDFFNLIFSNPENTWLRPNCTQQPEEVDLVSLVAEACQYGQWDIEAQVTAEKLSVCIQNDELGFRLRVCGNATFLAELLKDVIYGWVRDFCDTAPSPMPPSPMPPTDPQIDILQWCNYTQWDHIPIDPSVVGLCWEMDQLGFQKNVCCNLVLFEHLTLNPLNEWLTSVCVDVKERVDVVAQTCRYSDWKHALIVDMTDLALCADQDPENFTRNVCADQVVLQNLLANLDNTWLLQHCANHSAAVDPARHCQYASWTVVLPDPFFLAFCWDYDQVNFVASVCSNRPVLSLLSQENSSAWVGTLCATYANYTTTTTTTTTTATTTATTTTTKTPSSPTNITTATTTTPSSPTNITTATTTATTTTTKTPSSPTNITTATTTATTTTTTTKTPSSPTNITTATTTATTTKTPSSPTNITTATTTATTTTTKTPPSPTNITTATTTATTTTKTPSSPTNITTATTTRLNWSCSTDFDAMCHPGASKLQALQMLVRCGMVELQPRVDRLLTQSVALALGQATSLSVVLLVALEESEMTSVQVTENIRLSVLKSVQRYMEKESNFDNKRILLQCFGKVLTNLMQKGRVVTSDTFSIIKEYFHIPLDKLQTVLSAVDTTTIRLILEYFSRNRATLHLSEEYLQTMVSVFFHTHLAQDASLFRELSPLIAMASPADIQALPALHSNPYVLSTINSLLPSLTAERRSALGRWFARSMGSANLTAGGFSLIRDTGNLIAYLPFHRFQHLSPAQLLDGLDVLLQNTLTPLQQYFMAQTLTGTFRNLTADQFRRLGNVTCLANPTGLLQYARTEAFMAIQQSVRECVAQGYKVPSSMVSSVVLASSDLSSPSSLSAESLVELSHFLPQLGTDFLSKLSQSKLNFALPSLASVAFSPAQAGVIVDKLSAAVSLVEPGRLSSLGSLVSGVRVETLWGITSDSLLSALPNISLHQPGLTPSQANAITTKLWGFPEVTGWLGKLEPLLSSTPLLSVLPRTPRLVPTAASRTQPWTTQQYHSMLNKNVLVFLRTQLVPLHTSLKKCIIEELYQMDFFSELLGELGAQIALSLPVSTIKKFPPDMMDALRRMVLQEPQVFMLLPTTKKLLLVDKMLQRLNMYTGVYTEEEFRGMGVMATYVADEVFMQVNRQFLLDSLEMLQDLCYVGTKLELVAQMLQENSTFGPVQNWTPEVLIQVGRFLFFLKKETLQLIPAAVMTQERIERLFMSQQQWEESEFGALCMQSMEVQERQELFNKQQFVLQFFLGFLRVNRASGALVPSCESLHVTRPSAWTINSLTAMTAASFTRCLELLGTDPYLPTYQLQTLLTKAKEVYGPASSLSPSVIGQLGRLSSQFSVEELGRLNLSELRAVAALGAINTWSSRQLSVLFLRMLNSTKLTPSQLDSSSLVALGYIICGAEAPVMRNLNAVEFSKAVLWLGRLRLQCSEAQQRALVGLLSHSLAFGPISSWGTDVFLEISGLAVGLSDMEMSSLVREQIEGLTPLAVSLIPPDRFTVVFRPVQISMFSYEQAVAVTKAQLAAMSTEQQTALSMVINPWEDKPVDFRGKNLYGPQPLNQWTLEVRISMVLNP
ncbi:uncharacterized protein strc1 [Alosa pseudoharengus]|uniref:uncharacterized protein strc1 n=1 Tax=Alosa pseudoharengus TaxID=34774 RepID=UPI003F8CB417